MSVKVTSLGEDEDGPVINPTTNVDFDVKYPGLSLIPH